MYLIHLHSRCSQNDTLPFSQIYFSILQPRPNLILISPSIPRFKLLYLHKSLFKPPKSFKYPHKIVSGPERASSVY